MIGGPDDHRPEMEAIRERNRLKRVALWHEHNEKKLAIRAAFRAARAEAQASGRELTVSDLYAIRDSVLSPGDYGRRAPHDKG